MIAKELREARWLLLAGLAVLAWLAVGAAQDQLRTMTMARLHQQSDDSYAAVTSGHLAAGSAALWAVFFANDALRLLVGWGGALLGARLIAPEAGSGAIYLLLSRPLSRARILLTKYGIAAGALLGLCGLCGVLALVLGALQGVPPSGGLLSAVVLLWLGTLFSLGIALIYSVLLPNGLAAAVLGFLTTFGVVLAPIAIPRQFGQPGDEAWSLATYWCDLNIYAGVSNPVPALGITGAAALVPLGLALLLFRRAAY